MSALMPIFSIVRFGTDKAMQTEHLRIFQATEDRLSTEKLFLHLAQLDGNLKDGDVPSVYNDLLSMVRG